MLSIQEQLNKIIGLMETGLFENHASSKELSDCLKAFGTILYDSLPKLE